MELPYGLHSMFDIQKHKEKFINYLEVAIDPDGVVHYAIPSHQEYLINILCDTRHISREDVSTQCPKEYYLDFSRWLCIETGYCLVWDDYIIHGTLTDEQRKTLKELKDNDLYHGKIE